MEVYLIWQHPNHSAQLRILPTPQRRRLGLAKRKKKEGKKKKKNKAGYTATSCGRVGRGGFARFPTFRLMLTDGRTNGRTDGRTDKASYDSEFSKEN